MGPLQGVKIVELAGIGPGPFAGMLLSDMGADIVRVDRAQQVNPAVFDKPNLEPLYRGRRSIGVDLKNPEGVELVLQLVEQADALVEGYRPGVTERLGLGPDVCLARNPKLVYGRMTGWGQDGPMAQAAGHDINYIALAGALAHFGRAGGKPTPPINLVGDFGGGGMFMAFGDRVRDPRGAALGQGPGARRRDGRRLGGADVDDVGPEADRRLGRDAGRRTCSTPARRSTTRTRPPTASSCRSGRSSRSSTPSSSSGSGSRTKACPRRWTAAAGTRSARASPSCSRRRRATSGTRSSPGATPVTRRCSRCRKRRRTSTSSPGKTIIERDGVPQPAPAPRFSRTAPEVQRSAPWPGQHTDEALADWGVDAATLTKLRETGAIA